ncbi:MAG: hypothetical protein JWQ74_3358 [Marmoricola sp.]|nr:hypothetical protein [Marmoricola sp.]
MARTDDFKIAPDDGYRYSAPEPDRERQDREAGYVILALVFGLFVFAVVTGHLVIFNTY